MLATDTSTAQSHCPVCKKNLRVTRASFLVEVGDRVYCSQVCRELAEEREKEGKDRSRAIRWRERR